MAICFAKGHIGRNGKVVAMVKFVAICEINQENRTENLCKKLLHAKTLSLHAGEQRNKL